MASSFPLENRVQMRARKGHDMKWSCDKHAEPIAFYCKQHNIPICHRCATKDHGQKPCKLDDIEDVILERRRRLDDKQQEIEETKKQLTMFDSKIESSATSAIHHLQKVNDEVQSTYEDKSKSLKDKEETKIRIINEKADEEIRIINEKRDGQIKTCNAEIEKGQLIINENLAKPISETKAINEVVSKKIEDLKIKNQHAISTLDNIYAKIKRIKQDDKTLVNETPTVLASLEDNLNENVHQDVSDCLDQIQREVQEVKFVEGILGGKHYGRIDGYIGKWELIKSILIPSINSIPYVCGLISDGEICMKGICDNATCVINISNEHTEKVIDGSGCISYAPIDSNVILCVNQSRFGSTGDSLDRCITLYDRQWKVIRDISIPRNSCHSSRVYVDVDRDGMILAAQCLQSKIYVINPADGNIVNTITMQDMLVSCDIQALSSGDIVVKTDASQYTVISRSGEVKATICSFEWQETDESWCRIDKLTDTIYITYWLNVDESHVCAVDQVSCEGTIQARKIVEYDNLGRNCYIYSLVTPTGDLVAYDGDKVLVYKKRFVV